MKQQTAISIVLAIIVILGLGWWAKANYFVGTKVTEADNTPKSPVVEVGAESAEEGTYTVNPSESQLAWEGRKTLIEDYKDTGTIMIKGGSVTVGKSITGKLTFDMTSINVDATGVGKGEEGLEKHLKSDDFFGVEAHPTAEFTLKEATPAADVATSHMYTVRGDLTIKGITQEIEFPAAIYMEGDDLAANAVATLDRTKWDIRYGSDNFFDNLGNNVIDDNFTLTFTVKASK